MINRIDLIPKTTSESQHHIMSDENVDRPIQPRNPNNLQGLLRFAVEATRSEDAPNPSNYAAMDPERRRFLEEALKSMTVNVIEQLEQAAQVLTTSASSEAEQIEAIEIILDYVDNMDTANDFCKIGGLSIVLPCMESSPYSSVRSKTALLVAELAQNNPFSQKMLLDMNVLPKLIELLSDSSTNIDGIRAISSVVRSYEPCAAAFIDMGGLECILGCLQSEQEKLCVKSLFLMCSLCTEYPGVRDEFVKLKAVDQIVELLRPASKFNVQLEATLCVLNILTENVEAASQCRESHLNLQSMLQDIIKAANNKPECQETIEVSQSLLFKLFNSGIESNADR